MTTRRTTIIVAILLAVGTGWLTLTYLRSFQATNGSAGRLRQIVVAARDIPARAPITPDAIAVVQRPESEVDPDAFADTAKIRGAISLISIPAGSVLTQSKVGRPADVGLAIRLRPGQRAVSIPVDRVKDVAGLIESGDHVDVIANVPRGPGMPPHAATILRDVLVMAIGPALEVAGATPAPDEQNAATVTLAVTPKQADLLTLADINATLRLALRSPRENPRSEPVEALNLQGAPVPVPMAAPPAAAPATAPVLAMQQPAPKADPPVAKLMRRSAVMIIQGDQVSP
ncbi:MAG: Flp pilus assembly protein CpaB [Candidatus Baltobacteraceae bacterium]